MYIVISGDTVAYIAKDCKYQRIRAKAQGLASDCTVVSSSSSHSSEEACLAEACAVGTNINAINAK